MQEIIKEAFYQTSLALKMGEIPVGAVVFNPSDNAIISSAHNIVYCGNDATAHAEIIAIRKACEVLKTARLDGLAMYVTLEPCIMCAGAIASCGISRLYYGAYDAKMGAVDHGLQAFNCPSCHHKIEVYGGIAEQEAAKLMVDYFKERR